MTHQEYSFQERAAIMEYEGGLSRPEAERLAWILVYGDKLIREEMFEERAAIMEYEGGLLRIDAEEQAWLIAYRETCIGRRWRQEVQGVGRPHVRLQEAIY